MPDCCSTQTPISHRSIISDMAGWSHRLIGEVLEPGDCAIDLTAGGGNDTLILARLVGVDKEANGSVIAFDLQLDAITRTGQLLQSEGVSYGSGSDQNSIRLIHDCHTNLLKYITKDPKGVIANLGYLPGGDKQVVTKPETTVAALQSAAEILQPEGRLVVVVYGGHPGGEDEAEAVETFFNSLSPHEWHVVRLATINRNGAPFVLAAEKKIKK